MSTGRLTTVQEAVLEALAGVEPRPVLTGGGCLAGFHLAHRDTRDLDLFFRDQATLGPALLSDVEERLRHAALAFEVVTRSPGFVRYVIEHQGDRTVLDLVAEPVPAIAPAEAKQVRGAQVWVDSPYEVLVNKLTTLVSRVELRDLVDIEALLASGLPLEPALADAPRKDAGFSPLVLAHLLDAFPIERLNRVARLPEAYVARLQAFARVLRDRCLRAAWTG